MYQKLSPNHQKMNQKIIKIIANPSKSGSPQAAPRRLCTANMQSHAGLKQHQEGCMQQICSPMQVPSSPKKAIYSKYAAPCRPQAALRSLLGLSWGAPGCHNSSKMLPKTLPKTFPKWHQYGKGCRSKMYRFTLTRATFWKPVLASEREARTI